MVDIISYVATALSLGGNFLIAKQNKWAFPIWIVSNILWIVVNFISTLNVAQVIMYAVYMIMNIYGMINWYKRKDKKDED